MSYTNDSTLYLFTSLTAGSSHIITATSRLETILKANKIPFRAIDVATDEPARKLWGRRSKGRKIPGLVKYGTIIGDLEQIEEWNEYGELRQQIAAVSNPDELPATLDDPPANTSAKPPIPLDTPAAEKPSKVTSNSPHIQIQSPPSKTESKEDQRTLALRLAGEEAATKAKENVLAKLGTKPPSKEGDGKQQPASALEVKGTEPAEKVMKDVESEQPGARGIPVGEGRRRSVAPEIVAPLKRPSLADECAAVSSANFRAENAETLGLVGHHRGSIVSATSKEEQDQVARDLRRSISQAPAEADIAVLRETVKAAEGATIEEDEEQEAAAEKEKREEDQKPTEVVLPQKQDPKAGEKAGTSVED